MASTISAATLTVTHTEALTLNGVDRGVTNTTTISSINEVDHRILTIPTSSLVNVMTFSSTVGSGSFVRGNVKYIRITNKDDTNYVTIQLIKTSSDVVYLKLEKGQTFVLYNDDMQADDAGAAFSSFAELDNIALQANTAAVDCEVFIAST